MITLPENESDLDQVWDSERRTIILKAAFTELQNTTKADDRNMRAFEMLVFERRPVESVSDELGMKTHDVYVARSRITTRLREIAERLRALYEVET